MIHQQMTGIGARLTLTRTLFHGDDMKIRAPASRRNSEHFKEGQTRAGELSIKVDSAPEAVLHWQLGFS